MGLLQVTLHQGAIESIFLDSMHTLGISVDRPFKPVSIELSEEKNILEDVDAYPVKVYIIIIIISSFFFSSDGWRASFYDISSNG